MSILDASLEFVLGGGSDPAISVESYARMLTSLLPPGRLWRLAGGNVVSALLMGSSQELARLDARARDLLAESVPSNAIELLSEYEADLDIEAAATTAERQARITARYVARQGIKPADFQAALAPLLGLAVADVPVLERTAAMAASMGDPREIKRFFVYRDPALPGTYYLDSAQELLYDMNRSSCEAHVIESIDFLCDDPYSLCDRDLLGA